MPRALGEPITDGVGVVNFFNGRLLSARDMRREQDSHAALRERLGRAIGDGVVEGFEVTVPTASSATDPVVAVSRGLAVNRNGTALELTADVQLSLAKPLSSTGTPAPGVSSPFESCSGLGRGAPLTDSGVYLLAVGPATQAVGRAPVSGLGNEQAACNTDYAADGVRFATLALNLGPSLLADTDHLRNRVAHLMFGTEDLSSPDQPRRFRVERDPFGLPFSGYGLLDDLRAAECLGDDQVPLATIFWTPGIGIRFVDLWSVRRRIIRRSATGNWPELAGDRCIGEGEAIFLQFQEQIDQVLRGTRDPAKLRATDRFSRLPPAGFLPLLTSNQPLGFDSVRFFTGIPTRHPVPFTEGAKLEQLIRSSFAYPPIDLSRGEMLWLYVVRENSQAAGGLPGTSIAQPYLVFASGFTPYAANAQFDLSRSDFANYAIEWI
jgi:hypothetical protein